MSLGLVRPGGDAAAQDRLAWPAIAQVRTTGASRCGPEPPWSGDLRVEPFQRLHVDLLHAQDRVRPAEQHNPAVLSLYQVDVLECLLHDLLIVSVDHLVCSHS